MSISCILIPVLVGLICAILGYLIGRMRSAPTADNTALLSVQEELKTVKAALKTCETSLTNAKAAGATASAPLFDAALAAKVFGKKIKQDDLKVIEGIGPKIEELYQKAGIDTWLALSKTSKERSLEILHGGGDSFAMHDPATWAQQAELAYNGKWQELKDLQDKLDGGKVV
jgi:predicted flap endonuclease-1-like 5' DNA nuclease